MAAGAVHLRLVRKDRPESFDLKDVTHAVSTGMGSLTALVYAYNIVIEGRSPSTGEEAEEMGKSLFVASRAMLEKIAHTKLPYLV
jgi:hypothetical protein